MLSTMKPAVDLIDRLQMTFGPERSSMILARARRYLADGALVLPGFSTRLWDPMMDDELGNALRPLGVLRPDGVLHD